MIAVNVAMALAERAPSQVAILDFDVDFGQVATHLNVKSRLTVADLARDEGGMHEPDLLRTYAEKVEPGLHVIAAPATPEMGRLITAAQVEEILGTAPRAYGTVVVDAGSTLDERSLAILDRAEAVIVPITPEIGALKALHGFLEYLTDEGAVPAKSTFVLNHVFARDMLSMKQIENAIAAKVDAELPYDPGVYLKAVNEGVPFVRSSPASAPRARSPGLRCSRAGSTRRRMPDATPSAAAGSSRGSAGTAERQPVTFAWPAATIEIEPPHAHTQVEVLVRAGMPPAVTFVDPGVHGAVITGTHGCGVSTPAAAEVAAATCGFDGVVHIPKGATFSIGAKSTTRARSWPPAWMIGPAGNTVSVEGATPKVQVIWAPFTTRSGMGGLPCSTGATGAPCSTQCRTAGAARAGACAGRDPVAVPRGDSNSHGLSPSRV